jgi:hypothetical protein
MGFLKNASLIKANLTPDKEGMVTLENLPLH